MTDEVRYERVGAAAVLTIDRPHRRNALRIKDREGIRPHGCHFVLVDLFEDGRIFE